VSPPAPLPSEGPTHRWTRGCRHALWLAQPGYDASSAITHAVTAADVASPCAVRLTDFVENGAALLSHEALRRVQVRKSIG
jgi:hypothetical protein